MPWNNGLTNLRSLLAELYPTISLSRQAVEQAGMPMGQIEFSSASTSNWYSILKEADRRRRVADLIGVACRDYPERCGELRQAEAEYLRERERPGPWAEPRPDLSPPGATGVAVGDGATVVQQSGTLGSPSPSGSPPPGVVRKLLLAAFTAEELHRFCFDRPVFRPIVNSFGPGHGLDDMVDEVITYCEKRLLFPELLAEVSQENPGQYARFAPLLRGQSVGTGWEDGSVGSGPRTKVTYLSTDTIKGLVETITQMSMANWDTREDLLSGVDPGYASTLPRRDSPQEQIWSDLQRMNGVASLAGGEVPLLIWLKNAVFRMQLGRRPEQAVFQSVLEEVEARARQEPGTAGVPPSGAPGGGAGQAGEFGLPASERRKLLEQELALHQRGLGRLRAKKAIYAAGEEPLSLLNQIADKEQEIARIEGELDGLS
jgi:hypothetical protein